MLHCLRVWLDIYNIETFFVIKKVAKVIGPSDIQWLTPQELHLFGDWALESESYVSNIIMASINLLDSSDCIVWCRNKKLGDVTTSLAYELLVEIQGP